MFQNCILIVSVSLPTCPYQCQRHIHKTITALSCPDDTVSASSNMDMEDRVSHLEQKLQLQEDEIQLLKSALADALRRLGYCEEQTLGTHSGGVHATGRRSLATSASTQPPKGE